MAFNESESRASDKTSAWSAATTRPQFEEALQAAEDLLGQADGARQKADRALAAEVGIIAGALTTAIIVLVFLSGFGDRLLVLLVGGLTGLATAAVMHITVRARLVSQAKRDEQAAVNIVSLLRNVIELMTSTEKLSETQLRLAHARLSRFPIGRTSSLEN
ncbi:MAG TPA: hypothetical protein VF838_18265 [Trebonia sp.]